MSANLRYMQSPDVVIQEFQDHAVIVNLNTKIYCRLNRTSLDIWRATQVPKTIIELAALIKEQYDMVSDTLETDIEFAVEEMLKNEFLIQAL